MDQHAAEASYCWLRTVFEEWLRINMSSISREPGCESFWAEQEGGPRLVSVSFARPGDEMCIIQSNMLLEAAGGIRGGIF